MSLKKFIRQSTIKDKSIKFSLNCLSSDELTIVEELIAYGLIDYSSSAFISSCIKGNLKVFKHFLPFATFTDSLSGFYKACHYGHIEIVDELFNVLINASIDDNNELNRQLICGLLNAINYGNIKLVNKLLYHLPNLNKICIRNNDVSNEIFKFLLLIGIDIEIDPVFYIDNYYLYRKGLNNKPGKILIIQNFKNKKYI